MKIAICASMSASKKVIELRNTLTSMGHKVVVPKNTDRYADGTLAPESAHESSGNKLRGNLIRKNFDTVKDSDAILVVNEKKSNIDNYIGGNTLIEISFAHILNKEIYLLNDIPRMAYADEIIAMQPTIINGDMSIFTQKT